MDQFVFDATVKRAFPGCNIEMAKRGCRSGPRNACWERAGGVYNNNIPPCFLAASQEAS